MAHTKNNVVFGVYLKQNSSLKLFPKTTVFAVIKVYKSNHTSQPMRNIRISWFFNQQTSKSVRRPIFSNIVEVFMHFWTETSNSKRRYYWISWYIQTFILIIISKLIRSTFSLFRFSLRTPHPKFAPLTVDLGTVKMLFHRLNTRLKGKTEKKFGNFAWYMLVFIASTEYLIVKCKELLFILSFHSIWIRWLQ